MLRLKDRIQADLKVAMLARDTLRTDTLKGLKSAILYEEVAKNIRDDGLDDASIEQLVMREVKKRDEAAVLYEQGGNSESAAKERAEKAILSVYLPAQISQEEILAIVDESIAEIKPDGMKDMGKVIGAVKARTGNSADGALVAKLVKEKLQ